MAEEVNRNSWEGDIHFNIVVPKELDERMGLLQEQDPEKWANETELMHEAHRQLEEERQRQKQKQPEAEQRQNQQENSVK